MKTLLANRGWRHLLLLLSLATMIPSAQAYYIESDYPAVSSAFYSEMPASGGYLSLQAMNGGVGAQTWFSIPAGQTVMVRILVPPGVDVAAINGDTTWAGSTFLNVFDTYRSSVADNELRALTVGMSETLYQGAALTAPVYRYLVIKNGAASTFAFGNVTVMMNVANASTYNTWRATLSTPSATFSITPNTQTIAAGSSLTLTAQNGTIASCTSGDTTKIPHPTVSSGGTTATATLAATATAGTVTLSCTSMGTTPVTASTAVSVTALPPVQADTRPSVQNTSTGGLNALNLSATITPASYHTGTGRYYVMALVPASIFPSLGTVVAFLQENPTNNTASWVLWTGGPYIAYKESTLAARSIAVSTGADLSPLAGTVIYAGYSSGDDYVLRRICTLSVISATAGCE